MAERVDKPELVQRVARRLDRDGETVAEIVDGFLEEIYAALKGGEGLSLRGFGSFYVRPERDSWVFKFNPSQRLRALFGWSSTYHGAAVSPRGQGWSANRAVRGRRHIVVGVVAPSCICVRVVVLAEPLRTHMAG
jgi:DNA-binding protein HU-beta